MKHKFRFLRLATALGAIISLTRPAADATQPTEKAVERQKAKPMKISIKLGSKTLTATLDDNATTRDFVALLPLTLTLQDYNRTEKISNLPKKLSIEGAPSGSDPKVGDISYYAPWGNIAFFYRDFDYSAGLVKLGSLDGDITSIKNRETIKITIEILDDAGAKN